ncbi:periplasmic divalent cation tolerance protein [Novimethylophilus kurashikiensis]|uniref:Periplasmic divalent cation tolerance protein n=1 Tax=Novimethylophilus kurashikiensis TaxID=1825523 RepID=A0A2R5FAL9_9PROT|nr:divalent-cation tolerance protein CutA [Novimethylophilus kurashikiensis]GBG13953.1 periplasmic divalent cation tolerance protein [Novimethylophilus kurashikiensis]
MTAILVMSNWPDRETASRVAEQLVEARLAACVNLLAPCRSIYHWQGKTESAEEIPMLIKTTETRYAEVEQYIRAHHPYELPEILSVPVSGGLPDYLQWVYQETA